MQLDNTSQKITGLVRTTVQGLFAYLIAAGSPLLDALGVSDEFGALEAPITAVVVAGVLGAYWYALTTLQQSAVAQSSPIVAALLAVLMGGKNAPSYIDSQIVDV